MAPTRFPQLRAAARLANGFALEVVKMGGYGRDVIDGLLKMAILQANTAQITRSAELQRQYATFDAVVPDDLRRPVSINAVATSLRIPFETARRRIRAMADAGQCVMTPKGVYLPQAMVHSRLAEAATRIHYQRVRRLYERLRGVGLLGDLHHGPAWDGEAPPVRLVLRLASDYVLRLCEPLAATVGDPVTGLVLMDIQHANTEHFPDAEGGTDDPNVSGFPPDTLRRPVRLVTLSERLGIPQETVRRHVNRLLAEQRCERMEEGYMVTAAILARGAMNRFMLDNQMHLNRMFGSLAEHGVPAAWAHEADTARRTA